MAAEPRAAGASGARSDSLVILHTNDVHSHLDPFRGLGRAAREGGGVPVGGAAARASLIERERAGAEAALTLDAGDAFQGTAYYNYFRGVPEYRVMSGMGYDAAALGNHDLDDGPVAWLRADREARFPVLSANVFVSAESAWADPLPPAPAPLRARARWIGGAKVPEGAPLKLLCRPYVIRTVGGRRVAIFGLVTGDLPRIVSVRLNGGVAVSDPIAAAAALLPEIRRQADVVVALSHLGVDQDRRLAARVPGIDVIVGGHSHTLLRAPVLEHGVPIVQAGSYGRWLGRTTLRFDGTRIRSVRGTVIPIEPDRGEDPAITRLLRPYRDSMAVALAGRVTRLPRSYGLEGLRDGDTPLGNFVADALREAAHADVAVQNVGGIRGGLPAGDVTVGDLYTALPFDNRIVTVEMKDWQLRALLDFIARRIGGRAFAQVSGVRFTVRQDRAAEIRVGGRPLATGRVYRVATIDFLYGGGDGYTAFAKAGPAEDTGVFQRDGAIAFLKRHPDYRFQDDGRIRWEGSTEALRDLGTR